MLRTLLRLLPCRPSERARFRAQVIKLARSRVETGEQERKRELQLKEATFLLCAQQHLKELNARYFPTSGMSQQEVVAATSPTSTSLVTTPLAPVQKMEVDPVPSSGLKARSQVSLDFDSGIENMELEECK